MAIINTFNIDPIQDEARGLVFGIRTYKKDTETLSLSMNWEAVYSLEQIAARIDTLTSEYNDAIGLWNQIKTQAETIEGEINNA